MGSGALALSWDHYWRVPLLWADETAFLLGGGPSLTAEIVARLRGRHCIAINSSWSIAPDAEMLLFTDNSWFEPRRDRIANWPGIAVTLSHASKRSLPDRLKMPEGAMRGDFPPPGDGMIRLGRSTGHSAISLAMALGATTIVLLGYDMRVVEGREHCHSEYKNGRDTDVYQREFLPGFAGWNDQALARGVRVLNATPGSALTEFPAVTLDELL